MYSFGKSLHPKHTISKRFNHGGQEVPAVVLLAVAVLLLAHAVQGNKPPSRPASTLQTIDNAGKDEGLKGSAAVCHNRT